jgi:hypothetical protein
MSQDIWVNIETPGGEVTEISTACSPPAGYRSGTGRGSLKAVLGADIEALAGKLGRRTASFVEHAALVDFT